MLQSPPSRRRGLKLKEIARIAGTSGRLLLGGVD